VWVRTLHGWLYNILGPGEGNVPRWSLSMSFYVKGDVERHQRHNDEVLSEYVSPTNTVGLSDIDEWRKLWNCLCTRLVLFWQCINVIVMHYNGWYAVVVFTELVKLCLWTQENRLCSDCMVWNSFRSRDVQRKNVVNNVDMSSLRAPWQKGPYTNKHTEKHRTTQNGLYTNKHTEKHKNPEQHKNTRTPRHRHLKTYFLCFSDQLICCG